MKFFILILLLFFSLGGSAEEKGRVRRQRPRKERFVLSAPPKKTFKPSFFLKSHLKSEGIPYIAGGRWPDFCPLHLQQDPQGCSSWGEIARFQPRLEFTLYQTMADCYIDAGLVQMVGKKIRLIPSSRTVCNHLSCPRCKERVVQGYDDYEEETLLYKCRCTGRYWIGIDDLLNEELEEIVMHWKFCKLPAIHPAYFDWYHQTYFRFLLSHLNYQEANSLCSCYWRESSEAATKISNRVYAALDDMMLDSEEVEVAFIESFTPYLAERLHTEFLSGLLWHAFHYSHYQKILSDLALFAVENLPKRSSKVGEKLEEMQQDIAPAFLEIYSHCLEKHPHPKIYLERAHLLSDQFYAIEALEDFKKISIESGVQWAELGSLYKENLLYEEALGAFDKALKLNPHNNELYFERACVQFERGNYLLAFTDYARARKEYTPLKEEKRVFARGMSLGIQEGRGEFTPQLLATPGGLGRGLWESDEFELSSELVHDAQALVAYLYNHASSAQILSLPMELQDYLTHWQRIDEEDKGYAVGYIIGRYGADLFAYTGINKLAQLCRKLKESLAYFTLENTLKSSSFKAAVIIQSEKHREAKTRFLNQQVVDWERQIPPIPDLAQEKNLPLWEGSGYLTLSKESVEKLLKNRAGSGRPQRKSLGEKGYAERVNFGQKIGVWIENKRGRKPLRQRTSWGTIHYDDQRGYYLLPAPPLPL